MARSNNAKRRAEARQRKRDDELAADAAVALDAMLSYRDDRDAHVSMLGLVKTSIKLHEDKFPRRHFTPGARVRRLTGWQGKIGLITEWGHGEHHYVCVFCDDNLATFNNRGKSIPSDIIKRLERHGWECALRFLMDRVKESCFHLADSQWPGPPLSVEPCAKCGRYYVDET